MGRRIQLKDATKHIGRLIPAVAAIALAWTLTPAVAVAYVSAEAQPARAVTTDLVGLQASTIRPTSDGTRRNAYSRVFGQDPSVVKVSPDKSWRKGKA